MNTGELKGLMRQIAPVVQAFVGEAVAPLVARLDALDKQVGALPAPITHDDAKLVILAEIKSVADALPAAVTTEIEKAVAAIPPPPELPELPDIPAMVDAAVAALPRPQDGKSVTVEDVRPLIEETVSAAVSALPVPRDGKDADMDAVAEMIGAKVQEAVAGIELPKDGQDGRDGIDGKDGADGLNGKDGLDAVSFTIDRAGHLIGSMSDGTTRDIGEIIGKDGAPGKDGLSFDDFTFEIDFDGKRTFTLKWSNGDKEVTRSFVAPNMLYQGVYREGETYQRGDTVTWGGSLWHCDAETTDKPDGQQKHWTLAAKRGRDGKDGVLKAEKPPAPLKVG